jgi:hypothetical protein
LGVAGVSELEDAARFRARAEELRRKADEFSPENREMLLKMADNYDGIATHFVTELRSRDLKI